MFKSGVSPLECGRDMVYETLLRDEGMKSENIDLNHELDRL